MWRQKNRLKALYLFGLVLHNDKGSLEQMQGIASMASRYSQVYPELGVLANDLYALTYRNHYTKGTCKLSLEGRKAIRLWVAFFIWSELRIMLGEARGRCLTTFHQNTPSFTIEFDGSLKGIGLRIFDAHQPPTCLCAIAAQPNFDLAGQSEYQNTMEFAAVTCGIVALIKMGVTMCTVRVRGDSSTILNWVTGQKSTFKSSRARNVAIIFVTSGLEYNIKIAREFEWISSEDNAVCDNLSRGILPPTPIAGSVSAMASPHSLIGIVLNLCNPFISSDDEDGFIRQWANVAALLKTDIQLV